MTQIEMLPPTLDEQIACIERELGYRRETTAMESVLKNLQHLRSLERPRCAPKISA